jgi:DNA-binding HxlR family transcriptional regulator
MARNVPSLFPPGKGNIEIMFRDMGERRYGQFCPIARSLDLLGDRWTLLVVRELLVGPQRYSDLLAHLPGMWSNLLGQRLRSLAAAGLVRRRTLPPPAARVVYELTERGRGLEPSLYELARWGLELLAEPGEDALQFHLLPIAVKSLMRVEALPDRAFTLVLALAEGTWTAQVAAPGPGLRALDRVTLCEGAAPGADATVRGSVLDLLGARRGDPGVGPTIAGRRRDAAVVEALFSSPPVAVGVPA